MYTIKEVSRLTDISEHTLRFWARSDLLPLLTRNKNNVRIFSERDLGFVKIIKCLRAIGTDNKSIKRYIDMCIIGDSTASARYEIIKETEIKALEKMEELKKQLELLDYKKNYYKNLLQGKDTNCCKV